MNKKDFLDALHQIRTRNGSFSLAFNVTESTNNILSEFPELMETVVNDLAMEICFYAEQDSSDKVMVAEQSLYAMEKAVDFIGSVQLMKEFFSILEELSKVTMVYDGMATGIILEYILDNFKKYEGMLGVYPSSYDDVKTNLLSKYDWLEEYLEKS